MRKRSKLCPYKKTCIDACYGEQPCDFALAFDKLQNQLEWYKDKLHKVVSEYKKVTEKAPERRVFGSYVLTPVKNEFNSNVSWWLSKRGFAVARYCFTTSNAAEIDRQVNCIDQYIKMFEEENK